LLSYGVQDRNAVVATSVRRRAELLQKVHCEIDIVLGGRPRDLRHHLAPFARLVLIRQRGSGGKSLVEEIFRAFSVELGVEIREMD
jgi:hypothetical protein